MTLLLNYTDTAGFEVSREVLVVVPTTYHSLRGGGRTAAVVAFHGLGATPTLMSEYIGLETELEKTGWIGILPYGTSNMLAGARSFNAGGCCGSAADKEEDDIALARAVAEYLSASMCVDHARIYATGFSNGAMMSNRIGCELSGTFAAVAPVGGTIQYGGSFRVGSCAPTKPVAYFGACGLSDRYCDDFTASTAVWAERNGCDAGQPPLLIRETPTTKCYSYKGCAAATEFCTFAGLGHEWPGRPLPAALGSLPPQPEGTTDATAFVFHGLATVDAIIAGS